MEHGLDWIARHGYPALFALLVLGIVGLPVPDETLLTFAGYLSAQGTLRLQSSLATAFAGSACGISLSYAVGRFLGLPALSRYAPRLHISQDHIALTSRWVNRWGKYTLLIAYFIPGVRHVAAMVLGASLVPPAIFVRYAYTGALIWSGTFIGAGYVAGEQWQQLTSIVHTGGLIAILLTVLAICAGLIVVRRRKRVADPIWKRKE
jgi:membrane protein DedA with SNARE-associated domain